MKLLFLGTGATGSIKTPNAEIKPDQRRCASMMIDNTVVVDMALQSFDYATQLGKNTAAVTDIFLSHTHGDHYCKETLMQYVEAATKRINFWCHETAVQYLNLSEEELTKINICPCRICKKFDACGHRQGLRALDCANF